MLDQITPLILTYNEAPNIGRAIERLDWAREIVVVDSGSTDGTLDKLCRDPRVRIVHRAFDCHANQWNFAVQETGIRTEWVLALDADYMLTPDFIAELGRLAPPEEVVAFVTPFRYCIYGRALRGAVYPAKVTLFRRSIGRFEQDGHTQVLVLTGKAKAMRSAIEHDDRKPLERWIASQNRYMELEAAKLRSTPLWSLPPVDRIRRGIVVAPVLMFFYCAIVKGNILDGRAGLYYTFQRTLAELLLSLHLLEAVFSRR